MHTKQLSLEHKMETHHSRSRREHWNPAQKVAAVLRVLKGEPTAVLSEELGVSIRRLERWHSDFVAAGAAAMAKKKRPALTTWVAEHSRSIAQWLGLLLALVGTIVLIALFLRSGSPE
jgi:hypothetical protein